MTPPKAREDLIIAKQFLIGRVLDQAACDGVNLSKDEKGMLAFSEPTASTAELSMAERFEAEVDSDAYEKKIAKLVKRAYACDRQSGNLPQWNQSLDVLANDDLYLLVMVEQAGVKPRVRSMKTTKILISDFLTIPNVAICLVGLVGVWFFFLSQGGGKSHVATEWPATLIHSDVGRLILFVSWIGILWLLGEVSRRSA